MTKKEVLVITILLLLLPYATCIYFSKAKYADKIQIAAIPSNEGCDDFKQGWKVTAVNNEKYNFLLSHILYFSNHPISYDSIPVSVKSSGWLFKYKDKKAEYGKCNNCYSFYDEKTELILE